LSCAVFVLITQAACDSGGSSVSEDFHEDINNEVLRVSLDSDESYEWRVRAITASAPGPWSDKFLVETNEILEDTLDVSYIAPADISLEEFGDLLFDDQTEGPDENSTSDFSGSPLFTWEVDENAVGYEVEIVKADTPQRLGLFQYSPSSLCIEGICELVLDNTGAQSLDLPPIPIIENTVVQGEAPYSLVLPSPVIDTAGIASYSHDWSIEGSYAEFPDTAEFQHTFAEQGLHIVNVTVTSVDGRSGYAYATVEVGQVEYKTEGVILGAALPQQPAEEESDPKPIAEGLEVPVVTVREPGAQPVVLPGPVNPVDGQTEPKPVEEVGKLPEIDLPGQGQTPPQIEQGPMPILLGGQPAGTPGVIDVKNADKLVFNNDLHMGGLFYGHPGTGWQTTNALITIQSSRRFMAERSGAIDAVRYQNRTLTTANINDRCTSRDTNSAWCKCKNAGLDKYTCGYTLNNSYSVGNGGLITIEIQEDDGTDGHEPTGVALARSAPYIPMDIDGGSTGYPVIELLSKAQLQAGKLYHIVYINSNPPTRCKLKGVSIAEAANCPRDQGAVGVNGKSHYTDMGPTARYGPYHATAPVNLYRSSSSSSWNKSSAVTSIFEIRYEDGVWVGDTTVAYDSRLSVANKTIEGDTRGRQVFTVKDASRKVDGVWINYGQKSYANGQPMQLLLKSADGSVLATGEIPRSEDCMPVIKSAKNKYDEGCRAWGFAELSSTVELVLGSTYSLEFGAPSGAGFKVTTYFGMAHYGSSNRNEWTDAHAELSTNGGSGWSPWADSFRDRDIPMLFTIEGQPRQLR